MTKRNDLLGDLFIYYRGIENTIKTPVKVDTDMYFFDYFDGIPQDSINYEIQQDISKGRIAETKNYS
jgi:hypothetical protein